jgi:hypothetical protein
VLNFDIELSIVGGITLGVIGGMAAGVDLQKAAAKPTPINAKAQGTTIATIPPADKPLLVFLNVGVTVEFPSTSSELVELLSSVDSVEFIVSVEIVELVTTVEEFIVSVTTVVELVTTVEEFAVSVTTVVEFEVSIALVALESA